MQSQTHSHEDLPSPQSAQEQQFQELQLIRQLRQQDSAHGGSLQPGHQHALQLRQADLAAASSAGSVSPGATVGHRPLSRAHSSPVVGELCFDRRIIFFITSPCVTSALINWATDASLTKNLF